MSIRNTSQDHPFVNMLFAMGASGEGIEAQEKQGQNQLVRSSQLPVKCNDHKFDSRYLYSGLGFEVKGESPGDRLFFDVEMPDGWKIEATDTIQVDESYIGGKEQNKHWDKRTPGAEGRSTKVKTAALGIHSEEQGIYAVTIPNAKKSTILPIIEANVATGATVMTDEFNAYIPLGNTYEHFVVNHGGGEFAAGENNEITVNQVENYWSHFKRMFHGVHHHLSRKHMDKYLAAESFRYNERRIKDWERLAIAVGKVAQTYVTCSELTQD